MSTSPPDRDAAGTCRACGTVLGSDGACSRCLLETGMGAEGRSAAERVFRIALSYDEQERAAFVEQAAGGDMTLLEEVRMLLEGYAEAGGDEAAPTLGGAATARSLWALTRGEEPGTVIDHFRLVRLIGEGGMGSVWEAEQTAPMRRQVALKVIKLGMDTQEVVRRFERERRALALMTHPHIAQVYEAGATGLGRPYFAMELVAGEPITAFCRNARLGVRERLALFLEVCAAVEHAHQKGVIHRDLKPSNILVANGAVKVIDFGVAKATQDDGGADGLFTRQAQVLGTPAYMSPEQAESDGVDVDTRTDVYSLGVVLYELLSGVLPFDPRRLGSTSVREMQRILREEEPPRPSTRLTATRHPDPLPVQRIDLDGDLDWIVMKALSKERARRYPSAAALADDVQRCLDGRAVSAVPPTWRYQAGKFVRRHRAGVAATALVLLALAGGLVVGWVQARRTRQALAGQTRAREEATMAVSDLYARSGLAAGEKGEPSRAALWFAHAAIIAAADPARADANRLRAATWTAESRVPVRAFETGLPHIEHISFHPGGRALILTTIDGGGGQVWDLETEAPSPLAAGGVDGAAWDPGGSRLALTGGGQVRVLDYPSGQVLAACEAGPGAEVAFSPDGETLAVGSLPPFLWSWKTGATHRVAEVPGGLKRVRWSPDGRWVLWQSMTHVGIAAADRPAALLFDPVPNAPKTLADFVGTMGRFFHTPPGENHSFIRDAATGRQVMEIPGGDFALSASVDGRFLARAQAPLWDAEGGSVRLTPVHRSNSLMETAQFSRDGRLLATASYDATARLWSVADDRELGLVGWHQHPVQCVAFSPDSALLATSQIGLVRVWRIAGRPLVQSVPAGAGTLAAVSGDGKWFAPSGLSNRESSLRRTRVCATDSGQPAGPELEADGIITDAAFAPDGSWLAVAISTTPDRATATWMESAGSGFLQLWNWRTGDRLGGPVALPSEPRGVAVHPSGDFVGVYGGGGEGVEWERKTGALHTRFAGGDISQPQHTLNNGRCAYTAEGRFLLAWGEKNAFHVWDHQTARDVPIWPLQESILHDVGRHGALVALAPMGPSSPVVRFADLATGREIAPPLPHSDWLYTARFDDTGGLLLTTGRRPMAQVWDWRAGRLLGPALPHESEVMAGVFVPGTPWVITGAHDGLIRFWDRRSGMPVRPPLERQGLVLQLQITADGSRLIAAGHLGRGDVDLIDLARALPPRVRELDDDGERLLAEINAGATVHGGGGLVPLTGDAWMAKWRQFRQQHPHFSGHRLEP